MRTDLLKPYDWTNNPPDPTSSDYNNVLGWLLAHGAPQPTVQYLRIIQAGAATPLPGAVYPPGFWVWYFTGMPYPVDLALGMNSPVLVLTELNDNLKLHLELPPEYAPPAPPPPPPSATPQPENPVGAMENAMEISEFGIIPEKHWASPGDVLPSGTVYPNPPIVGQAVYQKVIQQWPWGQEIYWKRTDNIPAGATVLG